MSYFDGITSQMFKKDMEGNDVFFPWGVIGAGYIIPTAQRKTELFKTFKKVNVITLILVVVLTRFGWASLFLLPFFAFGYYIFIQTITRNMVRSAEGLKLSEAHKNSAHSFSYVDLTLLSLGALGFVIAGFWIMLQGKGFWIGLASVIFFGACLASSLYRLALKSKKT